MIMLALAVKKTRESGWSHIDVRQGDAMKLDFPDSSFDWVTSFHVMTVVPDPLRMMQEMVRVCKPGGKIVLANHFGSENPIIYAAVSIINPITKLLGWTTRLRVRDILKGQRIEVERNQRIGSLSVHRMVVARKGA